MRSPKNPRPQAVTAAALITLMFGPLAWSDPPAATQPAQQTIIEGQVFNLFGTGVQGVQVFVTQPTDNPQDAPKLATATTDTIGDFRLVIPGKLTGQVVVVMQATGYDTVTRQVDLDPDDEFPPFVDVELKGSNKVTGTVRDARTSNPIVGADVKIKMFYEQFTAESADDGTFEVTGLLPGVIQVSVQAKGYARESRSVALKQDPTDQTDRLELMEPDNPKLGQGVTLDDAGLLTVMLQPERIVHLLIVDENDRPISQALVECLDEERSDLQTFAADPQGRLTVRGLHYDTLKLSVRLSHSAYVSTGQFDHDIDLPTDATESTHTLKMQSAGQIVGTVTSADTNDPLNGARLTVGDTQEGRPRRAFTDWGGEFAIEGVAPGKQIVTVHLADHAPELREVLVQPGAKTTLNVKMVSAKTIEGTVVDQDGEPVSDALVAAQQWRGHGSLGLQAMTDAQGRFTLIDAPSDEFSVRIIHGRYQPLTDQMVRAPRSDYRFELKPAAPDGGAGLALKVGQDAPALALTTLDGKSIRLADLKGRWVFLDFWATWCGPCIVELPHLKNVYQDLGRRKDFVMLGISLDDSANTVRSFVKKRKIDWPQSAGPKSGATEAANAYGVSGIPATFVIAPDGKIFAVDLQGPGIVRRLNLMVKSEANH